jgi:hypothetical protein
MMVLGYKCTHIHTYILYYILHEHILHTCMYILHECMYMYVHTYMTYILHVHSLDMYVHYIYDQSYMCTINKCFLTQ